ncbi:MAG: hypothetical protein ABEH47_06075 [Haloferacaceae archaeon]
MRRGQATLLAAAVAVILLVGTTAIGVALADDALRGADRRPLERHAARTVADRLVTANETTYRDGVVRSDRMANLTAADLTALSPAAAGRAVRVRLGDETLVSAPAAGSGTTVSRVVRVGRTEREAAQVDLARRRNLTVPPGVERARVYVATGNNTTATTVLADGRPVLHADGGVDGTSVVRVSRHDPTRLRVRTDGNVTGRVRIEYVRVRTDPAVLEVTVSG